MVLKHDPLRRDDLCSALYRAVEQYDGSPAQAERLRALIDQVMPYEPRSELIVEAMARINYWDPLPDVLSVETRLLRNSQPLHRLEALGDLIAVAFASLAPPREMLRRALLQAAEVSPIAVSTLVIAGESVGSAPLLAQQLDQVACEFLEEQRKKAPLSAIELLSNISLRLRCVSPLGAAAPWIETTQTAIQDSALVDEILDWSLRSVVDQVVPTALDRADARSSAVQGPKSKRHAIAVLRRASLGWSDRSAASDVRTGALVCAWVCMLFRIDASCAVFAAAIEGLFRALVALNPKYAVEAILSLLVRTRPCLGAAPGVVVLRGDLDRCALLRREGDSVLEEIGTVQALLASLPVSAGTSRALLSSLQQPAAALAEQEQAASEVLKRTRPEGPTTWQRHNVCGKYSVFLTHDRSLGDREVCASVCLTARPECTVALLSPTLSLIAMNCEVPIVYEQSQDRSGAETTAIDLTTGARCRVRPPTRQQVVLLSEAFGGVVDHLSEAPLGASEGLPPFEFGGSAPSSVR